MKGLRVFLDEASKKRIVQIEMEVIERRRAELSNMLDLLVAQGRKDDEMISGEKAKIILKKSSKL